MPPTKRVPTRKTNSPLFSKPIPTLKPVPVPVTTTTTTRSRRNPQPARQRRTISTPIVTPPTVPLFKDGPVLKEVGYPIVPIVPPNIFLPPAIVPVRPPPAPIDNGINSNPLSTGNNTGGSIHQPSIFPGYAEADTVVTEGIDDNTTMLIIAVIVCGFIILKKS